jgi:hypothetical protein
LQNPAAVLLQPLIPLPVVPVSPLQIANADTRLHIIRTHHWSPGVGLGSVFGKEQQLSPGQQSILATGMDEEGWAFTSYQQIPHDFILTL